MDRGRSDHIRLGPVDAARTQRGEYREQTALGAAGGHRADRVLGTEGPAREADQIPFHGGHRAEDGRIEAVDRPDEIGGVGGETVEFLVTAVVDVREDATAVGRRIRLPESAQGGEDRFGALPGDVVSAHGVCFRS